MKVIIFGASGMVGQGVLRECLLNPNVDKILTIVRKPSNNKHTKLQELIHQDFFNYSTITQHLTGYDACFFCLGVSSTGMTEAEYHHMTYDLTFTAARALATHNTNMTFIYVSAVGADSSENGRIMWARVRGKIENAILKLPFKAIYLFRPGYIQPMHGIRSKTKMYYLFYLLIGPFYPILKMLMPKYLTTTEQIGQAMIQVATHGTNKTILHSQEINKLSQNASA